MAEPNQKGGSTSDSSTPSVYRCSVVAVDVDRFTMDVAEIGGAKQFFDVGYSVPYMHASHGGGLHFMPEVGAISYVMTTSTKDEKPVVLGYTGPAVDDSDDKDKSQRGNRPLMHPGDIYAGTVDGNYVFVRRGGVIDIAATKVCRRLYIPVNNYIKDFCQNYELHTMAGGIRFNVQRLLEPTGMLPTSMRIEAKAMASDGKGAAFIIAGGKVAGNELGGLAIHVMPEGWGTTQVGSAPDNFSMAACSLIMDPTGLITFKSLQGMAMEAVSAGFSAVEFGIESGVCTITSDIISLDGPVAHKGDFNSVGNFKAGAGRGMITCGAGGVKINNGSKGPLALHTELQALTAAFNVHAHGGAVPTETSLLQQVTGLTGASVTSD